jgi:pimeloyl-ACP methyl ester carboxylesterase
VGIVTPARRSLPFLAPSGFAALSYTEWGAARGPVALCIHGLTRNARDFDALAAALAADGYRVVCPDMPGRGTSSWLTSPAEYGYATYLAATAALIARLDVEHVQLVGTSMGGLIGMMLAAQPGSPVERLVINDVGPFIPKAAVERIAAYLGVDPLFATIEALEQALRKVHAPFGALSDSQWRHLAVHSARPVDGGYRLHYDPRIAHSFKAQPLNDIDLWPVWDRVGVPALVLRGAESDLLLAETAAEMARRGPAGSAGRVRVAQISGCGHAPALMAEDQIALVRGFLREAA